jgi:hypothetical protein
LANEINGFMDTGVTRAKVWAARPVRRAWIAL